MCSSNDDVAIADFIGGVQRILDGVGLAGKAKAPSLAYRKYLFRGSELSAQEISPDMEVSGESDKEAMEELHPDQDVEADHQAVRTHLW